MIARRGFTLWEIAMVLAIMAVTAAIVVPQWTRFGDESEHAPGQVVLNALRDARRLAIESRQIVALRLDPLSGVYQVDTSGVAGSGVFFEGQLELGALESIESDLARVQFVFRPTGATFGDTLTFRTSSGTVMIAVDPWSGVATAYAR